MTQEMAEKVMESWDGWRKYIAEGGTASWPRDEFENLIDWYEGRIEELEKKIEEVLKWRNLDGDGISDPLRQELYKLVEKKKGG